MDKLVFRSACDGDYNTLYLNGTPFYGWKPDTDPFYLIEKLGTIGKYEVDVGPSLSDAEYEKTWL